MAKLMRPCIECGTPTKGTRCLEHQRAKERAKVAKRKARGQVVGGSRIPQKVRLAVLERDGYVCQHCGKHLVGSDATADHYPVALVDGGPSTPDNLVASCLHCNLSRAGHRARHDAPRP